MTWEAAMRWALIFAKRDRCKYFVIAIPPYTGRWTYAVARHRPVPLDRVWPRA
jgi:hypothetical protein